MEYTCIDSFCGAGGLSLGLQSAGVRILFSFDTDEHCIETHRLNPKYFRHKCECVSIDAVLSRPASFIPHYGKRRLFLLAGGPPCQGFSVQRIGEDNDLRNHLVLKYAELIKTLRPRYFLMENVPGINGRRGKAVLEAVMYLARSLGYWVHVKELDAQDFGVPQRRRRVFVVGEDCEMGPSTFTFPEGSSDGQGMTVYDAIGHLPPPPEDGTDHPDWPHHRRDRLSELNKRRIAALRPGQGREHLPAALLAKCHRLSADRIGHRYVYGRMEWGEVAPTITARFDSFTRGKFGHPKQCRSISLREGALLQTFPSDFVFSGNKVDIARQIGNAVPPKLAEAIGKQIILCHSQKKSVMKEPTK